VDDLLSALAATEVASLLRKSRWGYAAVSTAHVLGIAMLVGAILPLDLRLLGLWRTLGREALVRVLAPCAAAGLLLAAASGALLFSVRAPEYARNPAFLIKLSLVAAGAASALLHHLRHGAELRTASPRQLRMAGAISILCWLGALVSGRLIAFVED
jgi:hypothetical protein